MNFKKAFYIFSVLLLISFSMTCISAFENDTINSQTIENLELSNENYNDLNEYIEIESEYEKTSPNSNYTLNTSDLTIYFRNGTQFTAQLFSNNELIFGLGINFTINNITSYRTIERDGFAKLTINLSPGEYEIITSHNDIQVKNTIIILTSIDGNNITKYYLNDTQYYARILDGQGNIRPNISVLMNINGIYYNRTTDDKGIIKLSINLIPKTYIITVYTFYENQEKNQAWSNTIIVLSTLDGKDIELYYKNGSQFEVKSCDNKGNVLRNTPLTMNINGVFYTRTTDSSGIARLTINLFPATYIITVVNPYDDLSMSYTIKVIETLTGSSLTKSFSENKAYETTVLDGRGNKYANQDVVINIHGVFYTRTTDNNGIARLNINLNPGNYIATASFNGFSTSHTITVNY